MVQGLSQLLHAVYGTDDLASIPTDRVRELAEEFPFFHAAQFLLAAKLRESGDPGYIEQSQRAALYFNNPLWLQWQLDHPNGVGTARETVSGRDQSLPVPSEKEPEVETHGVMELHLPAAEPDERTAVTIDHGPVETTEEYIADTTDEVPAAEEITATEDDVPEGLFTPQTEITPAQVDDEAGSEQEKEDLVEEAEEDMTTADPLDPAIAADLETDNEPPPPTPGIPTEMAAFEKPAESIVFTPYHVVDYFASQGIRLQLEANPTDSLGKQLKSFTEWLKILRKTPQMSPLAAVDETEEKRIAGFAAHSVEEKDVLTETMAEVLVKQGMFENAIALYRKLSLIYPPKSGYFASRIEQIKHSMT